jgi:hypothetical protein
MLHSHIDKLLPLDCPGRFFLFDLDLYSKTGVQSADFDLPMDLYASGNNALD